MLSLEKRIPVSESDVRISFPWFDVLKDKKKGKLESGFFAFSVAHHHLSIARFTLAYERANTLFNIAAVLGQLAVIQNRDEVEVRLASFILRKLFHQFSHTD